MDTEGSGASRAGEGGIHNEDAYIVEEELGLYCVCDGESSRPGGEIASNLVAGALEVFMEKHEQDLDLRGERAARALVGRAMRQALQALEDAEQKEPDLAGLTTTVTMLLVRGDLGVIAHRGDSRAYLIRRGRGVLLTIDHEATDSVANEDFRDDFDLFSVDLKPGDTIVLCTDGAERVVQEREIVSVAADLSPRVLASRIVSLAHRRNPGVDATAVVVRARGGLDRLGVELSVPPRRTSFGHTLELA